MGRKMNNTNFIIIAIIFTALVSGAYSSPNHDHLMDKNFEECLAENNITKDDFRSLMKNGDSIVGCVLACKLEKAEVLKDGVIDESKALEHFKNHMKDVDEAKLSGILQSCLNEAKGVSDKCELAGKTMGCVRKEIHALMKKNNDKGDSA